MHIARTILPTVLAAGLLSVAFAQMDLTSFASGDPIVAAEVNANFEEIATAVQSIASGTANVTAFDMLMLDGAAGLTPARSRKYHYLSAITTSGITTGCYGANFDLPDGATITSVSATMDLSLGSASNDASAEFWHRSWTSERSTEIAFLNAFNSSTGYVTQTVSGPFADEDAVDVKANEREYGVTVCLTEDARFFHAQVAYEIP